MIVFSGDWHVGLKSYRILEGQDSRYIDIRRRLKSLGRFLQGERPTVMVLTGDLFERTHPSPHEYFIVMSFLKAVVGLGIEIYVIAGNHDRSSYQSALKPLKKMDGVHVVDENPEVWKIEGKSVLFVPHLAEFEKGSFYNVDILVAHASDSYESDQTRMFPIKEARYKIGFSGHIHDGHYSREYNVIRYGEVEIRDNRQFKKYRDTYTEFDEVKLKVHQKTPISNLNEIVTYVTGLGVYVGKWEYVKDEKKEVETDEREAVAINFLDYHSALHQWIKKNKVKDADQVVRFGDKIIDEV
jgi:DNA repair exonuclease SbcCD nuclease subunit